MKFIADFHIHSKYSRATSKNLDLENIYIAAQLKGITVVGTGDFTHPGWFSEIREKLVPAEEGLFKLKEEIAESCDRKVPLSCRGRVRFILVSEISNIYKKNNKTRKNHNLVFAPDLDVADKFNAKLDRIGNIKSDGRPILGLDAKNLLEILLETADQAFLVPAHIWTPWFSILGSRSGFDSIEECFEDLTPHIFAVETGLSSDPAMNWRVSSLDNLTLISNSDAHSPSKLGREANLLDTSLSYSAIKEAIKTGDPGRFLGTFEFYPEEGKYYLDGHRKCNVRFWPKNTMKNRGICPVCGKALTIGVLSRVEELADRPDNEKPEKTNQYYSIIPMTDILSEILQVGSGSKKVAHNYNTALKKLGPEFAILHTLSTDTIDSAGIPLLAEAIYRMRKKKINILPGYDGEFGRISIFQAGEREKLAGQKSLFIMPDPAVFVSTSQQYHTRKKKEKAVVNSQRPVSSKPNEILSVLNKEQQQAVLHDGRPLLVVAGPGTGKTRTLTHRIAYLLMEKGVAPENILAVTFTNKAAQEMSDRLRTLIGGDLSLPLITTFHSLCFKILKEEEKKKNYTIINEWDRKSVISEAIIQAEKDGIPVSLKPQILLDMIISAKQKMLLPGDNLEAVAGISSAEILPAIYRYYQKLLSIQNLYDYEDLIFHVVRIFQTSKGVSRKYQNIFRYIFVDEYQDLNQGQYQTIRALAPAGRNLCVIGDPDQSIYGFRGSDVYYFNRFINDYPETSVIKLTQNYRSTETILAASDQVMRSGRTNRDKTRIYSGIEGIKTLSVFESASEKAEAVTIGRIIEKLIGGMGFHSIDFGKIDNSDLAISLGFRDIAVLYRTGNQSKVIAEVFDKAGIPYQLVSRDRLFHHKSAAGLISLLKTVEGFGAYADLERIVDLVYPGIGKKTLDVLKAWGYKKGFTLNELQHNVRRFPVEGMNRAAQINLCEFLNILSDIKKKIKDMTVENKLFYLIENTKIGVLIKDDPKAEEAVNTILRNSQRFESGALDFCIFATLQTNTDTYDPGIEKVTLMTMHTAKGLEFPAVFISGCEKDLIPFKRSENKPVDIEEERRLFYVAMTRAKERLYLTCAKKRRIFGRLVKRELSPFVKDIENRLIKNDKSFSGTRKDHQIQLKLF